MKGTISLLFILFSGIIFQKAIAQKGDLAIRLDVGYGIGSGAESTINNQNGTYTETPNSFGAGTNIAIAGNYMLGDHLGVGLDLNELVGTTFKSSTEYVNNFTQTSTDAFTGSLFAATPYIIVSANADKINLYGRFGIVVGLPTVTDKTTWSGAYTQPGANVDVYTGGAAVGIYAAFGVQYPIGHHLKLNAELFDRDLTYRPTMLKNPQTFAGNTPIPTRTLSTTSGYQAGLTQPMTFGSIGLKIGVSYSLIR